MILALLRYGPAVLWTLLVSVGIWYGRRSLDASRRQFEGLSRADLMEEYQDRAEEMTEIASSIRSQGRFRMARQLIGLVIGIVALLPTVLAELLVVAHIHLTISFPVASIAGWVIALGLLAAQGLDTLKERGIDRSRRRFRALVLKDSRDEEDPQTRGSGG